MNRYDPAFEIRSAAVMVERYPTPDGPVNAGEIVLTMYDETKAQCRVSPYGPERPIIALATEADFAADTLTFKCPSGYHAAAGRWLLIPLSEYLEPLPDKPRVSLWARVFGA